MRSSTTLLLLCLFTSVVSLNVYVGSLNTGIWIYKQNDDGRLTYVSNPEKTSSGFLALSGNNLYATGAGDQYVAYSLTDGGTGLKRLNSLPGHDGQECWTTHVSVHPNGRFIFGANYKDGSFVSFSLNSDGSLKQRTFLGTPGVGSHGDQTSQHRQDGPHAHMIVTSPDPNFVIGMDLGADRIWTWSFNQSTGEMKQFGRFKAPLGSGPRHIAFSPNGTFAYVVDEIGRTVLVLAFKAGKFAQVQKLPSLDTDQQNDASISAGEIRMHPSGKFVYVTNRNGPSNNIGVFAVDQSSGKLTGVQWVWSHGGSPRGMNVDPTGKFLYVANENANDQGQNLFAFSVDQNTGKLTLLEGYSTGGSGSDVEFGK